MARRYRVRFGYVWVDHTGKSHPELREVTDETPGFQMNLHKLEAVEEEKREAASPENRMVARTPVSRKARV